MYLGLDEVVAEVLGRRNSPQKTGVVCRLYMIKVRIPVYGVWPSIVWPFIRVTPATWWGADVSARCARVCGSVEEGAIRQCTGVTRE
jgi:hypothetical protein